MSKTKEATKYLEYAWYCGRRLAVFLRQDRMSAAVYARQWRAQVCLLCGKHLPMEVQPLDGRPGFAVRRIHISMMQRSVIYDCHILEVGHRHLGA